MPKGQTDLLSPIWGDYFAGGAGASTGIACAVGEPAYFAVNHSRAALDMYRQNHPHTRLYCEDVFDIDPVKICDGHPVWLLWASPDCTHHSKARGGKPVSKRIRGLPWAIVRAALKVRPGCIMFENVEEIQSWGPCITDSDGNERPDPERKGETFQGFISIMTDGIEPNHPAHLECCEFLGVSPDSPDGRRLSAGLGYDFAGRELVAADYGAPTIRKRFYGVFRCDGKPIVWPEPTHSKTGAEGKKKWRSAAEVIDWTLPCPSIFKSKAEIKAEYGLSAVRPLAENTMKRIIRGVDKFTIKSGQPYIVPSEPMLTPYLAECNHAGGGHVADVRDPYKTITAKHTGGIVAPSLIQYHTEQTENVRASGLGAPMNTVDASNRYGLTCANLVEYYSGGRPLDVHEPMHTITSHDREAVVAAHIAKYYGGVVGEKMEAPLPTVTAIDHNAVCAAHVVKFKGDNLGSTPAEPLQTVTASAGLRKACGGGTFAVCDTLLCKADPDENLYRWPLIRDLLNRYCGYELADDDLLLLSIGGTLYFIADIGLRMLSPRELYNAMGFPSDYCIDFDADGKPYSKSEKVARCGNAVCPAVSEALVRANFPERCTERILTMEQLEKKVAV